MKKILSLVLCAAFLVAGAAVADAKNKGGFTQAPTESRGGFQGPGRAPVTAREAATMRDDAPVVLRGNIVQHLGGDKYLFQDASGTIRVDIDDEEWRGQIITPEDIVEIRGEVDKDWNSVEVEVNRISKAE
jgi:TIGR00156 family protein